MDQILSYLACHIAQMSEEASNYIGKLVDCSEDGRVIEYERFIKVLNTNAATGFSCLQIGNMANIIADDLQGDNEKLNLYALNICSWIISGNLGSPSEVSVAREPFSLNEKKYIGKGLLRLLHSGKYDMVLMCLFILAQQVRGDWIEALHHAECAAHIVHMVASTTFIPTLCKTKQSPAENYLEGLEAKMRYWSYRALARMVELQCIRYDLLEPAERAILYVSSLSSILKVLTEKPELFTSPLNNPVSSSGEESNLLPLVQLDFLLQVPVGTGLVHCLQHVLSNTGLIGDTVSAALKRSSVSGGVVHQCSKLWRLWVRVAAELLVSQELPTGLMLTSGGGASVTISGMGGGENAKNAFMDLLAPKNGVGVLTAPLQPILRRSRSEAAQCYSTLAQCLVLAKDWHQPASVLKLLLRCLYHLLFTDVASIISCTADLSTPNKKNISVDEVTEEVLAKERDNLFTLKTAGEAMHMLCANIPRQYLRSLPLISISLGRLPSTACNSTASSPRGRKATATATVTTPATATATTTTPGNNLIDNEARTTTLHAPVGNTVLATPSAKMQHTTTTVLPAVSTERASLDIIIRKLLDTTDFNTIANLCEDNTITNEQGVLLLLVMALSRVQQVCSGAIALSLLLSGLVPSLQDKFQSKDIPVIVTANNVPNNTHGAPATRSSKSRRNHLSKGLFASPNKIAVKPPVSTSNSNNNDNATIAEQSGEELTCSDILNHIEHLHTAIMSVTRADSIHTKMASKHTKLYNKLVGSLDLTSQLHNACAQLTTSWQLCTLSLAQALFDDLALTEINHSRDGDGMPHSAPRYQSTQLDSFSLLFSAPTQASQVHLQYQHHHQHLVQNYTPNRNKRSPHKFSNSSNTSPASDQLHPGRVPASLPASYPAIDTSPGQSPAVQVVLCSAHPPAVQAAVDLCSLFVKAWVDMWMGTPLGRQQHKQRGVFVESFWWFLHRTTAFGVDAHESDSGKLFSAVLLQCPSLSVLHCPTNMAGIIMLVSVCHAYLCDDTAVPLTSTVQPVTSSSLNVLLRALHQSVNSMTESGVLPGLFAWVPPLFSTLCLGDAHCSTNKGVHGVQSKNNTSSSGAATNRECITISASHVDQSNEQCVRFVCAFLRHSLQQLSSMSVPSASEQHSPSLMHNMIAGLRCLLVSPLVLCVAGMRGLHYLFESNMPVVAHGNSHINMTPISPAQQVIANWKSILSLWLELQEFVVAHFGDDDNGLMPTDNAGAAGFAWIEVLLSRDLSNVTKVPFHTYPRIKKSGTEEKQAPQLCADDEYVQKDLLASIQLVQAALEVSVQHRRKYPLSPLTAGLTVSAAAILESLCSSLCVARKGNGDMAREMKEFDAASLKAIDGLLSSVLQLFPTLDTHLTELGAQKIKYCVPCATESTNHGALLVKVIFKKLFQCISEVHHAPSTALSSRYVKQWTLSVLSSLCAHHTAVGHRTHSGFRSAGATLAVGDVHRTMVRTFAASLTGAISDEHTSNNAPAVDAEMKEFISTAWRELGGADSELLSVFDCVDVIAKPAPLETLAHPGVQQASSMAALPSAPGSTVGVKRSFVPALASPAPAPGAVVSDASSFASPPPKIPKFVTNNAAITPVAPVAYVKVALQPSDLASLAQKTSNTRQGFVPATYTGADRANLNEQSQQSQSGPSQLISQFASQAMPPPLSPYSHATVQKSSPRIESEGVEPSVASRTGMPVSASSLSPPPPLAASRPDLASIQQASQHSDSTTYVSPSPALAPSGGSVQRRQSLLAMSAPRTPASLPLLDHMQCEGIAASTEPTVVVQDSHSNRCDENSSGSSSSGAGGIDSSHNVDSNGYGAMELAQSELDHNNHTIAPESHPSDLHHANTTNTVLAASEELHQTIRQLNAMPSNALVTGGPSINDAAITTIATNRADLLGAAIRQSHKLTGLLLDLLSENAEMDEK